MNVVKTMWFIAFLALAMFAHGKPEQEVPSKEAERVAALTKFRAECGGDGFAVGRVTSMEAIRPRAAFKASRCDGLSVRLAKNERESFQLVVTSMAGTLKDARVEFAPLKSEKAVFAAENLTCSPVGYVETKQQPKYVVRPKVRRPAIGWWPDAILDFTNRADIAEGDVQAFWIRVKAPKNQAAGVYSGEITVKACQDKQEFSRRIPITVRVNDFALPDNSMLPLAITFHPSAVGAKEVRARRNADTNGMFKVWTRKTKEYADFLSDYYLSWDDLYLGGNRGPNWEALKYQHDQGRLGMFNLKYWWYAGLGEKGEKRWYEHDYKILRKQYDRAKELGILDHAYFYGCDEQGARVFTNIAATVKLMHKEFPGVKIMTTTRDGKLGADGSVLKEMDIFCPANCFWNPKGVEKAHAAGRQVWWYFCCDPTYPYANTMVETPPIEIRSFMGAQTVKYRPDGFLYYQTSHWNGDNPIMTPFYDWSAQTFGTSHGDGQWTCCGGPDKLPLPTLRLENFRDGLEDYAYAKILEEKLRRCPDANSAWAMKARAALAVPSKLVKHLSNFSINPDVLYAWRNELADLIDSAK